MTQPIRPSSVRVVAVVMADGSDPYAPENLARIHRALLSIPRKPTPQPAKAS
ncbi:envelope glycoprotein gp160, env [Deinococcus grandis]|uniref:Envelope glycoprotein gp160, env n=1 Tax=Deinococcus grandis TaxID=57498 RepID=A0A117DMZ5_9DEIO|nr:MULTISPECIES: hypothetical protein [Deinococcus]BBN95737.1 hypothetical protein DEGR_24700 [Deinococcus grandis]GAQ20777.1 envelope glycoprotein gp160, env [Deinococcus grandis]